MNPLTRNTYRNFDGLSFRLHQQARRHRSRVMAALFAGLIGRLSALRLPQMPMARWG